MIARDIMSSPPVTVAEGTLLPEVARIMQERNIGAVIVVDGAGALAGLITESDFTGVERCIPFRLGRAAVIFGARAATVEELERIYAEARTLPASRIMSRDVVTVAEDEPVGKVIRLMLDRDLKHLPVVRGGGKKGAGATPVGMIARHDIVKLAMDKLVER